MLHNTIHRRALLRVTGVSLFLPLLESLTPAFAKESQSQSPRRMLFICRGLGLHGPDFFPQQTGSGYELTSYLQEIADYRNQFTIISGISHPNAGSGHAAELSWLTGAPHAGSPSFKNSVSVDQLAA